MPLPAGFKVNGTKVEYNKVPVTPRVQKIIDMLKSLPVDELLTTLEITIRLGLSMNGNFTNHPALNQFREKIDNKLFWGNRKSIEKLRKQLAESEGTPDENQ